VYLGPDIELTEAPDACAANHQHLPVPEEDERTTRTQQRLAASCLPLARSDLGAVLRPLHTRITIHHPRRPPVSTAANDFGVPAS
jgi:hypothetical protein